MSVLDTIDTTVTVEWQGHRTIGTLVEMSAHSAVVTALRLPDVGESIAFQVEGETEEEAVTIDGICVGVGDSGWGELRAEIELLRVGTTCSASRLRDFIESWAIARGGSVHIGQNREQPNSKRFVYHVPDVGGATSARAGTSTSPQVGDLDLPSRGIGRRSLSQTTPEAFATKRPGTSTAPGPQPRRQQRETVPASPTALGASGLDTALGFGEDDEEFNVATNPERTLNSEVAAGFQTGGTLDAAFREALRAVEQPRIPAKPKTALMPTVGSALPTGDLGDAGQVTGTFYDHDDGDDEPEPTQMMDAVGDDGMPTVAFETGALSPLEASQLMAKVDDAIAFERSLSDSEHFDMNEPIVVNTVPIEIPFADPVQLGNDNRAPSMAEVTAAPMTFDPPSVRVIPPPEQPVRKVTVAESLSLPLKKPAPLAPLAADDAAIDDDGVDALGGAQGPDEGDRSDPLAKLDHEPSEALRRIAEVFAVDIAVRCDLPIQIQLGRKKYDGTLIRLAESKLRVASQHQPELYQSLLVLMPDPAGGKKPFALRSEVMRVRERENEESAVAFDLRVAPGNKPREMNQLRALIKSFHAPGT